MTPLPSNLSFASFLQYASQGQSASSAEARRVMLAIKNDKSWPIQGTPQRMIAYAARRIQAEQASPRYQFLGQYLNSQRVLVPLPRSSPIPAGALWPAKRICDELLTNGLGSSVSCWLERTLALRKSSTSPGNRPSPQEHFDSLQVAAQLSLSVGSGVTLVDDVVTRGATFLGAAAALLSAFPGLDILCFAMVRTISPGEVATSFDPVQGSITLQPLHRQP